MKRILVIEDDKVKIERLKAFFVGYDITLKESFQTGVLELKNNYCNYDYLILDMTIPLWEKGNNSLGGDYEQFGGERVMREMKRKKFYLPTVLFTMFDVFPTTGGKIIFEEMNQKFKVEFPDFYLGAVFYNSNEEDWKVNMLKFINK